MSETPKPKRTRAPGGGRRGFLEGGKRVNVYLDAESLETAEQIGRGNISDGIRRALKEVTDRKTAKRRQPRPRGKTMGKVLVSPPDSLTQAEREAFDWAVSGLEDALGDSMFLRDNPGIATDADEQMDDILYRLEEQTKEMVDVADPETSRIAQAAKRAARKIRAR